MQAAAAFGGWGRDGDALRDGRRDGGERQALRAEERNTSWMPEADPPINGWPAHQRLARVSRSDRREACLAAVTGLTRVSRGAHKGRPSTSKATAAQQASAAQQAPRLANRHAQLDPSLERQLGPSLRRAQRDRGPTSSAAFAPRTAPRAVAASHHAPSPRAARSRRLASCRTDGRPRRLGRPSICRIARDDVVLPRRLGRAARIGCSGRAAAGPRALGRTVMMS